MLINKIAFVIFLVFALMGSSGMAFANQGIDSASGVDLPISAGGTTAITIHSAPAPGSPPPSGPTAIPGSVSFALPPQLPTDKSSACSSANVGALRWNPSANNNTGAAENCGSSGWQSFTTIFPDYSNGTGGYGTNNVAWTDRGNGSYHPAVTNNFYQAPADGYLNIVATGSYMNWLDVWAGPTKTSMTEIWRMGDDINDNTKASSAMIPMKMGTWFAINNPCCVDYRYYYPFEWVTITFFPAEMAAPGGGTPPSQGGGGSGGTNPTNTCTETNIGAVQWDTNANNGAGGEDVCNGTDWVALAVQPPGSWCGAATLVIGSWYRNDSNCNGAALAGSGGGTSGNLNACPTGYTSLTTGSIATCVKN